MLTFLIIFSQNYGEITDTAHAATGTIVNSPNPSWFMYSDGQPFFLAGAGDPENFLYRGSRNSDGTRTGDQIELINKRQGAGVNGIYLQAIRSHGGDGDSTHNPFNNSNPAPGLDNDILNQWDMWFTQMDNNGIVIYFHFYDDNACIWECNFSDTLPSAEVSFIQAIVNRFENHKNIIWVVAEEYEEKFSPLRVSRIAQLIKATDDFDHPVGVHKLDGFGFSEFADDPFIDFFLNTT